MSVKVPKVEILGEIVVQVHFACVVVLWVVLKFHVRVIIKDIVQNPILVTHIVKIVVKRVNNRTFNGNNTISNNFLHYTYRKCNINILCQKNMMFHCIFLLKTIVVVFVLVPKLEILEEIVVVDVEDVVVDTVVEKGVVVVVVVEVVDVDIVVAVAGEVILEAEVVIVVEVVLVVVAVESQQQFSPTVVVKEDVVDEVLPNVLSIVVVVPVSGCEVNMPPKKSWRYEKI